MLIVCLSASSARGVDVSEPRWGFDGNVRQHRFNLLTVTVDNPSPQAVEVNLVLRKSLGMQGIDAPLVEPVFLAPGTRRTVQFYPYVSQEGQYVTWRLSWGRESFEIPQPQRVSRRGARVLLDSTEVLSDSKSSLRRFPVNQFPASVTATDTLQAVVLDHAPNWDEARRLTFLDWLYRGGAVFVLQAPNGKYPEFPAALNQLNAPLETVSYGSGVIHKVARTRSQLTREEARGLWRRLPNQVPVDTFAELQPNQPVSPNQPDDEDEENLNNKPYNYADGGASINSRSFLDELKKMTKPEHNWLLLHFMFWIYIVLIFPGCYLVGKQRNDFRAVYLALVAIVVVFSLAFGIVGKRGYGEDFTVNSVAIVTPLPDGHLDVAQWSNAFVTGGAVYDIRHKGTGAIYSTCQDMEAVNEYIKNGAEAVFRVDIPPYSSREFAHRIKVPGTLPPVRVAHWAADDAALKELTLAIDNTFPPAEEMYVLYRDRFYNLSRKDDQLLLRGSVGAAAAFLRIEQNQGYMSPFAYGYGNDDKSSEVRYREMFHKLATRSLNIRSQNDAQGIRWAPNRVRLMYYADMLPDLAVQHTRFSRQKGKALYCVDLPLTESP